MQRVAYWSLQLIPLWRELDGSSSSSYRSYAISLPFGNDSPSCWHSVIPRTFGNNSHSSQKPCRERAPWFPPPASWSQWNRQCCTLKGSRRLRLSEPPWASGWTSPWCSQKSSQETSGTGPGTSHQPVENTVRRHEKHRGRKANTKGWKTPPWAAAEYQAGV